jgi:hypothetical protein
VVDTRLIEKQHHLAVTAMLAVAVADRLVLQPDTG